MIYLFQYIYNNLYAKNDSYEAVGILVHMKMKKLIAIGT